MLDQQSPGFRVSLRGALRNSHDRVDATYSALDFGSVEDIGLFFRSHRSAFAAIGGAEGDVARLLARLIAALDADLAALGSRGPADLGKAAPVHPLAAAHIVLGSRLGSKVLRQVWLRRAPPELRRADRYFSTPSDPARWRAHCRELDAIDAPSRASERIARDCDTLFRLFETSYDANL